jgi:predicted phosphodiesterase
MKYVILSDIHANHIALNAVIEEVKKLFKEQKSIRYIFLGDLVGYGSLVGTLKSIQWLRSLDKVIWVPGNHDEWLLKQNVRIAPEGAITLLAQRAYLSQDQNVQDWKWFKRRATYAINNKPTRVIHAGKLVIYLTHGTVMPGNERGTYLWPWQPNLVKGDLQRLERQYPEKTVCLLYGHTHFPMSSCLHNDHLEIGSIRYGEAMPICDDMVAINPGSVGQPRDGNPNASFAILDTLERTIEFHRVAYDISLMEYILEADGHFNSRRHPLSKNERETMINHLVESRYIKEQSDISKRYTDLIERLKTGNGGTNLAHYQSVYRQVDWGLEKIT